MVHRGRRASGEVIVHVAEVKPAGSDPAVFAWAAVVARRVWRTTWPASRHSKLTAPRGRWGAPPGVGGVIVKVLPDWRALRAEPTSTKPESAPSRLCQRASAASK